MKRSARRSTSAFPLESAEAPKPAARGLLAFRGRRVREHVGSLTSCTASCGAVDWPRAPCTGITPITRTGQFRWGRYLTRRKYGPPPCGGGPSLDACPIEDSVPHPYLSPCQASETLRSGGSRET